MAAGSSVPDQSEMQNQILQQQIQRLQAAQAEASLQPKYPELKSLLDGNGKLNPDFSIKQEGPIGFSSALPGIESRLNNINLDTSGVDELKKEALAAPGTGAWEQMMKGRQGLEEMGAQDNAARTADAGKAQAFSSLATSGGLSGGARERLARLSGQDLATQKQNVLRQGQLDRSGIGVQAEQNRLGQLSQLPGAQIAALQPELAKTNLYSTLAEGEKEREQGLNVENRKYNTTVQGQNIANSLSQNTAENANRLGAYSEAMKAWAANKQAGAQQDSGKK